MKFIFFTDLHIRGNTPENRNGDFQQDLLTKFQEVVEIGKQHKVDYYINGGDFVDNFNTSIFVVDKFMDIIEKSGKIWYTVLGNHDIQGYNAEIKTTTLQHYFSRCNKFFKHLTELEIGKVKIYGFDSKHNIEKDIKAKGLFVPESDKYKIGIPHAFLHNKKLPDKANALLLEEIKTNLNLILITHNHLCFNMKKVGNTTFISLGALARLSAHEKDFTRTPKVLIFDCDKLTHEIIELKTTRPSQGLFKIEQIKAKKDKDLQIEEFFNNLKNTKISKTKAEDIVKQIIEEKQVDSEISKVIFSRWV